MTLHRRGISRDSLLAALVDHATADYQRRMWPILTSTSAAAQRLDDALAVLCDVVEEHMALLLAVRDRSDAVFHQEAESEPLTRTVFTEPFVRLLAEAGQDGTVRVEDPAELATLLFNQVGWTYIHLRTGHRWAADRCRRAVLDLALHGVLR